MQPREALHQFLSSYFRGHALRDDEDIFASGRVNSLFAMKLVMFIESEFGLTVDQEDLDLVNFRTVDAMVGFIARKRDGSPHGAAADA